MPHSPARTSEHALPRKAKKQRISVYRLTQRLYKPSLGKKPSPLQPEHCPQILSLRCVPAPA